VVRLCCLAEIFDRCCLLLRVGVDQTPLTHPSLIPWKHVKILRLTKNMRLLSMACDGLTTEYIKDFNDWVLSIGDGSLKGSSRTNDGDSELIDIPPNILIAKSDSVIDDIIRSTYPNLAESYSDPIYLRERAIISPKMILSMKLTIMSFL
jgi:hypothetical protein